MYKSAQGTKSLILRLDLQNCTPIPDKRPRERQHAAVTRQLELNPRVGPQRRRKYTPGSRLQPASAVSAERASLRKASHALARASTPEVPRPRGYTRDSHWTEDKSKRQVCTTVPDLKVGSQETCLTRKSIFPSGIASLKTSPKFPSFQKEATVVSPLVEGKAAGR